MLAEGKHLAVTTAEASTNVLWDVVVVGGGPAGIAAALAAGGILAEGRSAGVANVVLIDMADGPGGALAAMGLRTGNDAELVAAGVRCSYRTTLIEVREG